MTAYTHIEAMPEQEIGELVDGQLVVTLRGGTTQSLARSNLGFGLEGRLSKEWWVLPLPELQRGENVLVPESAAWRRDRNPRPSYDVEPDWLCEVTSGKTERKMDLYAKLGVPYAWLVNPARKTLEVLRLEHGKWVVAATHGGTDKVRAVPFDGLEVELGRWWLA